jgi:hypothetical protein
MSHYGGRNAPLFLVGKLYADYYVRSTTYRKLQCFVCCLFIIRMITAQSSLENFISLYSRNKFFNSAERWA